MIIEKHKENSKVIIYFRKQQLETLLTKIGFTDIVIYPVNNSQYAIDLFKKGINNKFQFSFYQTRKSYNRLIKTEDNTTKGLYLIVKAKKRIIH